MIPRFQEEQAVARLLRQYPVVAILGARQVGKTTLAHEVARRAARPVTFFDLENPDDLARLVEPMLVLIELRGLVVIDEVQRLPGKVVAMRTLVWVRAPADP